MPLSEPLRRASFAALIMTLVVLVGSITACTSEPSDAPLAEVAGIGAVRMGTVPTGTLVDVTVERRAAPTPPAGSLALQDGLDVSVRNGFPTGYLEIQLALPPEPSPDAVPAVLHVADDGSTSLEPGLYDPATNTITVWANTFSDRFGGWFNPLNWAEETIQVGQGIADGIVDTLTGRSDPPACGTAPDWFTVSSTELSSVHLCPQTNAGRAELLLAGNRGGLQAITVPSTTKDYLWVENQDQGWVRDFYTIAAGVDPATHVVLVGHDAMSLGFDQPQITTEFEMRSFLTARLVVVNVLAGLFGVVEGKDTEALLLATMACARGLSGFDELRLDTSAGFSSAQDALTGAVSCALELLANPALAVATAEEVLRTLTIPPDARAALLNRARTRFSALGGMASRLATVVKRAASRLTVLANVWDGLADSLAEDRIDGRLTGADSSGSGYTCQLAREPARPSEATRAFDAVGDVCGYPQHLPHVDIAALGWSVAPDDTTFVVTFGDRLDGAEMLGIDIASSADEPCPVQLTVNFPTGLAGRPRAVGVHEGCAEQSLPPRIGSGRLDANPDGTYVITVPTALLPPMPDWYVRVTASAVLSADSTTVISDYFPDQNLPTQLVHLP